MPRSLAGLRILIVEDESMVAMFLEDTLRAMGCVVAGMASRLGKALSNVASLDFDAAILDVNLEGVRSFAVADALQQKGIPFVMATGYGASGLPDSLRSVPLLEKPFLRENVEAALRTALDSAGRDARRSG